MQTVSRQRIEQSLLPLAAVVLGLAVGAVLVAIQGKNPADAAVAIWHGAFANRSAIGRTLEKATPLILSGVAIIVALKAGLFNIGAQGQLILGAAFSAYIGYRIGGLPKVAHLPLGLLVGALMGAVPAAFAAFLKVTRGVHEVISTIMLNSILAALTEWLAVRPWKKPGAAFPRTPDIRSSAAIPRIGGIPTGFFIAVAVAFAVAFLLTKTTLGFRISTVGANRNAAHYAGIRVGAISILAMAISGFLAGLGGAIQTQGVVGRFETSSNVGLGFDGIAIALLARLKPRATIPCAILVGAMRASDTKLQSEAHVAPEIVSVIVAVILLFVAAPALVRVILRIKTSGPGEQLQLTSGWGS